MHAFESAADIIDVELRTGPIVPGTTLSRNIATILIEFYHTSCHCSLGQEWCGISTVVP